MMNEIIYLDNSATTKPYLQVIDAMVASMRDAYYNPSALYQPAVAVERTLEEARTAIAAPLSMKQDNVIFTSGGTESNNLGIFGFLKTRRERGTVLYSAAEHAAVRNACLAAETMGFEAKAIPLDSRGVVDLQALEKMLDESVTLICVMQVCNETGAVMPLEEIAALRNRLAPNAAFHVDGVQGYLRIPLPMKKLNIQSYAVSAHKVHGPKGVGALIVQTGHHLQPLIVGGGQQKGLRAGTDNTTGIAGFAKAVQLYKPEAYQEIQSLKTEAVKLLRKSIPEMVILGPEPDDSASAAHILSVALPPVKAETMVHALSAQGIIAGTGSACSSRSAKRSVVLSAMGVAPKLMDSAIRLSFSPTNTIEEIRAAAKQIAAQYQLLSRFVRR